MRTIPRDGCEFGDEKDEEGMNGREEEEDEEEAVVSLACVDMCFSLGSVPSDVMQFVASFSSREHLQQGL